MSEKNLPVPQSVPMSIEYSGPLPNSAEYAGYETVLPGAAERILRMAEKEAEHRREVEKIAFKATSKVNASGQIFGFIIAILSLAAIFASIIFNQPIAAIAPAIIAFVGLASVFAGKKSDTETKKSK